MSRILARDAKHHIARRQQVYTSNRSIQGRWTGLPYDYLEEARALRLIRYEWETAVYFVTTYGEPIAATPMRGDLRVLLPYAPRQWALLRRWLPSPTSRKYQRLVRDVAESEGVPIVWVDNASMLIPACLGLGQVGLFDERYIGGTLPDIAPALHA